MYQPSSSMEQHRHHRQRERDRNIPSALLCLMLIIVVSTALAHPHWFYLKGGSCTRKYVGVQEFLYRGNFESSSRLGKRHGSLVYYELNEKLKDCLTPQIVNVQRIIMALCFFSILFALTQFFMDLIGVTNKWLKAVRRNAVLIIIATLLIVSIIGLCFLAAELMKVQQEKTKIISTTAVVVDFSISYYLMIGAGIIGIIATGANLLQRYPAMNANDSDILLDDCQSETFNVALPHSQTWSNFHRPNTANLSELPPPPPYTP